MFGVKISNIGTVNWWQFFKTFLPSSNLECVRLELFFVTARLSLSSSEKLVLFCSDPNLEVVLREHTSTVEKLLQLLQQVVTQPGNAHRQHIGSALSLCMNVIYPVIADSAEPSVKSAVFQLLYKYVNFSSSKAVKIPASSRKFKLLLGRPYRDLGSWSK